MDLLRIAGASINQTPLDWEGNLQRLLKLLAEAKREEVQLLCFPELALSGYNCEDMFMSVHTARQALASLERLMAAAKDMLLIVGMPIYHRGSMYNCAAVVQDGRLLGINAKKILPREGVHYEPRWFRPWPFGRTETIHILGQDVAFGDLTYELGNVQLGVVICEEAWSAEGSAADAALARCEVVVNLSASHFAFGKAKVRETLVADASRSFQAYYLYTNLLGLEAGRQIYDGEILLGACGPIQSRSERFRLHDGSLLISDVDLDLARVAKLKNRSVLDSSADREKEFSVAGQAFKKLGPTSPQVSQAFRGVTHDAYQDKAVEFLQAEKLGLFDYLRKSGGQGYMISLSGGCDSSAIAVLCAHTLAEALHELGPDPLAARMGWTLPEGDANNPRVWIKERIFTLYQATAQSGQITRAAAAGLAAAINASYEEVSVEEMVQAYRGRAEQILGRSLSWQADDIALQNIQARARAPMIWLLANLKGFLLLATSNRSEVAVGYATMDGDTAGGLAPLSGIDKHYLRSWLVWAEKSCSLGLGKIPELSLVNQQSPTAELRPSGSGQKDEIDLMPYDLLATIETAFIRDRMEPESILGLLRQKFGAFSEDDLRTYLARFYRLWCRNQWKRERYAPGFHVDDYSLEPTSWCRFPILSAELLLPPAKKI